ncbi:Inorganic pyrophosphatase [Traorella massiliensis]|uniref:Inorganic pyrophosphatase n=1 Tax=Traorella massiliensis TaxID=1903263 RepID=UPI0008F86320|nr:Inorganic pyrophosphatase [Traorella massiliensis]
MNAYENNAFFWQKLDTLYLSSQLVIDRPKNTCHYKYSNLVYPVDYGYLSDSTGSDQSPIDVFKGSIKSTKVGAIVVTADILKRDCEAKLLIGCSEEEIQNILVFLNQTEFQKAVLLQRGDEMPDWASAD